MYLTNNFEHFSFAVWKKEKNSPKNGTPKSNEIETLKLQTTAEYERLRLKIYKHDHKLS